MNSNIFLMGGYGLYIWPAYGFTFLVFAWQFISMRITRKRIQNKIKNHYASHE